MVSRGKQERAKKRQLDLAYTLKKIIIANNINLGRQKPS